MTIAKGIAKTLTYKKEVSYGALAGASGAQRLRRRTSRLNLKRDTYQNDEIATHQQVAGFNLGTHRATADIDGLLSPATWKDILAASLRKGWVAGVSGSEADFTSVTTGAHTIVAASGSFVTKGFKAGDVIRCTGLSDAANNNVNLRLTNVTADTLTVAETLVVNAVADTAFTIAVAGKKLWVPSTGHTNDSFNLEHSYSDVGTVEVGTGFVVNTIELGMPSTGNATIKVSLVGQTVNEDPNGDGSAPYFTSPTAETSTAVLTAVRGTVRLAGNDVVTATGLTLNINGNLSGDPVIGSNLIPEQFPGRVVVTGQFTAYYRDGSFRSDFKNETELSLHVMMKAPGSAPEEFIAIYLPRIKLTGDDKDDGEKGLIQTIPFQAILPASGASDLTTIMIQDSLA